jgi:hypothetical protein
MTSACLVFKDDAYALKLTYNLRVTGYKYEYNYIHDTNACGSCLTYKSAKRYFSINVLYVYPELPCLRTALPKNLVSSTCSLQYYSTNILHRHNTRPMNTIVILYLPILIKCALTNVNEINVKCN